ncbi:DNA-binding YbaB/EbfC family protein [Catenulispora sp. GAS73]|nr:YbaB/EbfC family nucleoid-associated protein [Catenulispora rubra]
MAFPDATGPGGGLPDFGGMDLQGMLGQAMQMQQRMVEAQQELENTIVSGSAGGGLVTAKVTGTGELVGLDIKPEAADPEDTETLADLVIAAVRDARAAADKLAADTMGPLAGGGMPDLGNLGNLFG